MGSENDRIRMVEIRHWPITRRRPFGTTPFRVNVAPGEEVVGVEGRPNGIGVFVAREADPTADGSRITILDWEGGSIAYGRDGEGDLFVSVNTEDAVEDANADDGWPTVYVYLNDATLHDAKAERD